MPVMTANVTMAAGGEGEGHLDSQPGLIVCLPCCCGALVGKGRPWTPT